MNTRHGAIHVLVVDDNRDVADSLAYALALEGLHVDKAYDGETGLRKACTLAPAAIILDLLLPDLDGYLLAQTVRGDARCSNAFLIAYTGDGTETARRRCAAAGIDMYVLKPASPEKLHDLIARATGLPRTAEPPSARHLSHD